MSSELILYQTEDGQTKIQTRLENETVWLTQAQMIELFGKAKSTISEHLKNIFEEGELDENSVVRNFRITAADGKDYQTNHYNLDVIISVGYRVKSLQGTKFRQWATARLREYLVKGFTMSDVLLKQAGGGDYFDELFALETSALQKRCFGARCWMYMLPVSITTHILRPRKPFLKPYKIKCIGLHTGIPQQK